MGMQKYRAILLKLGDIYVETVEVLNSVINIILVILLLSWCLKFNDDLPQWPREEHWGAVVMISCKSVWDRISRRAPRNPTAPPLISLETTQISPRSKSQFLPNCKFLKNQSDFVYSTCRLPETGAVWDLFCSGTKLEMANTGEDSPLESPAVERGLLQSPLQVKGSWESGSAAIIDALRMANRWGT